MKLSALLGFIATVNVLVVVGTHGFIVSILGATREADALFAGMALPQVLLTITSGTLPSVLVPLFATRSHAQADLSVILFAVVGLFGTLLLVLGLTAPLWLQFLLPGFSASERALTASLTQIQLVGVVFSAAAGVMAAFAHAKRRFVWAETAPLIAALSGLLAILLTLSRYGVFAAAWIAVLRGLVHFVGLLPLAGAWRFPDWRSPVLAEAWRRAIPLLAGSSYYKIDPLVDRFLASMAPAGSLTLLTIGQQVYSAGSQVVTRAMVAPLVPTMASHAQRRSWAAFRASYRGALLATGVVVATATLALMVRSEIVTALLSNLAGLSLDAAETFRTVLLALIGLFVGGCLGQITSTAFYAMGDTRTPTRLGIWTFSIYVPIKCVAFALFGLVGLANSISAYYLAAVVVQLWVLERMMRRHLGDTRDVPAPADI